MIRIRDLRNICDSVGDECSARILDFMQQNFPELVRVCNRCGILFLGRKDAKFCSQACKKRFRRTT